MYSKAGQKYDQSIPINLNWDFLWEEWIDKCMGKFKKGFFPACSKYEQNELLDLEFKL